MLQNKSSIFDFNKQLSHLVYSKFENIKPDSDKSFFIAFIIGKAYKTHKAIMLLCKQGYGEDAFMLARTLFELMITTSYIFQDDSDERLMRYMEYDWVTRKKMYDYAVTKDELSEALNKKVGHEKGGRGVINQVQTEYKRVMTKYKYNKNGWSDKSISGMAESIGRGDAYNTVYKLQCIVAHTNARSINEYMDLTNEGLVFNIGRNDDSVEKTLVAAFDFLRSIIEEANKQFTWNLGVSLESLYEKYVQAIGKTSARS
ncbi:MAG: hypothetical protein HY001_04680 [Candidatus Portnoybacteria bacterium]|nr:hypothetical protein [Candidatus Portnoybacteria bacterium]